MNLLMVCGYSKIKNKFKIFHKIIFFLVYIFFISNTYSLCNIGCLQCDISNNTCQLCDFVNLYELDSSGTGCQKHNSTESKCLELDLDYKCVRCEENFYYNDSFKKCVEIPSNKIQENCLFYISEDECILCKSLFYVMNKKCEPVEAAIEKCQTYLSSLQCKICDNGYLIKGR